MKVNIACEKVVLDTNEKSLSIQYNDTDSTCIVLSEFQTKLLFSLVTDYQFMNWLKEKEKGENNNG